MKRVFVACAHALALTRRGWLAAAALALVGLGSHAACEPVATAIVHVAQRSGFDNETALARGVTVLWELLADLALAGAALRVRDRSPQATLAATLRSDATQCGLLALRLRHRYLFWLRPFVLTCLVLAGAVSVGRLVGGQLYASCHGVNDLFAQLVSRAAAFAVPLFVLTVLFLPVLREALFLAVTRTDRSLHIRGRTYSRELVVVFPLVPLALLAAREAARWARWA